MNTRRNFIKTTGMTTAALGIAPGLIVKAASDNPSGKNIRIGIIGAENSHTIGYGKMFNTEKKFPGVEVKYVWGETDQFAKRAMELGNIPNQVKDPSEMMGKIDALIVDHRHAKYHLDAAAPFVKAGIPAFIDKPFCYKAAKGKEFLQMALEAETPVSSYSTVAYSTPTFDMKAQAEQMESIKQVIRTGPVELDSKYGGVFFYGVHLVQPLMFIFGEDIERVRITLHGNKGNAGVKFASGLFATLVFSSRGWNTFVETSDGLTELKPRVEETDPPKSYADMVDMFRTGKKPRSYQSILNCVSVLEALEKSASTEKWVEVEYQQFHVK